MTASAGRTDNRDQGPPERLGKDAWGAQVLVASDLSPGDRPPPVRRSLRQPGPSAPERVTVAGGTVRHVGFTLAPGLSLNEAITRPLVEAGLRGGTVELSGGALAPMRYVIPALSPDDRHAAWYSDVRAPPGDTLLEHAVATFGERDGLPFTHIHGVWREPDGSRRGGHVLPLDTIVAAPIRAAAWGCREAAFRVGLDPESNFSLFRPEAPAPERAPPREAERDSPPFVMLRSAEGASRSTHDGRASFETPASRAPQDDEGSGSQDVRSGFEDDQGGGQRVLLVRIGPNEEPCDALERLCDARGIARAAVRGIGSLVGVDFADGRSIPSIATELFVRAGRVAPGADGRPCADLDILLVDREGAVHEGAVLRGRNAVCITMELCVAEQPAESGAPR